jgi:hypothetical protein
MPTKPIVPGQRFGRLVVLHHADKDRKGNWRWECVCDCGNRTQPPTYSLVRGETRSCGCLQLETRRQNKREGSAPKHGHTVGRSTAEYRAWNALKTRCTNTNIPGYKYWGGRGITLCERWRDSFEAFLADMGPRPSPKHSLDRIDNDGNYEPGNCRWATASEQNRNQRRAKR